MNGFFIIPLKDLLPMLHLLAGCILKTLKSIYKIKINFVIKWNTF